MTGQSTATASGKLTRKFILDQITTDCSIGIHDFEKAAKQRILVDLEVHLASDVEPSADSIDEALNYDDIRQAVLALAAARHYDLQETLARAIFDKVRAMKTVVGLSVRTSKPDVYQDLKSVSYQLSDIR